MVENVFLPVYMPGQNSEHAPAPLVPAMLFDTAHHADQYPAEVTRKMHPSTEQFSSDHLWYDVTKNVFQRVKVNCGDTCCYLVLVVQLVKPLIEKGSMHS